MQLSNIVSDGTFTPYPRIVTDGFNLPSVLNNARLIIFVNGLFASGSLGVPKIR